MFVPKQECHHIRHELPLSYKKFPLLSFALKCSEALVILNYSLVCLQTPNGVENVVISQLIST